MAVDLGSTFKELIDEINSKSDGNIDISGKTNTSVLPNDVGDIKTKFRIAEKGYTQNATWYFPILKFPANNAGNYASAIITGRIGGWTSGTMSFVNALLWNRDTPAISLIDIAGTATGMNSIWGIADLVLYVDTDNTATVYIKCHGYFTFDIDLELFQASASIIYNGSHITTTPSGTLTAQASTSTKRLELVDGKLLANGQELQIKLTAGNNITISGTTISATQPTVDSELSNTSTNAVQNKVVKEALDGKQASGNYVKYTAHSGVTAGKKTNVTTYSYQQSPMVVSNGIIIGGTAQDAGLITRGICGATTPDTSTGACTTDNLYVNYDGDSKYSRYLILGAGATGASITTNTKKTTHAAKQYGTLMSAIRGDQMVNYVSDKLVNVPTADEISEIKAAVAGKAKSYVLSYNDSFTNGREGATWYDKDGNDITSSIGTGSYTTCNNDMFNLASTDPLDPHIQGGQIIVRIFNEIASVTSGYNYLVLSIDTGGGLNVGDNIYVIETDVPDRWYAGNHRFYALESKLTGYASLSGNNTFTGNNKFKDKIQVLNPNYVPATFEYDGITTINNRKILFPEAIGTFATQEYVNEKIGDIDTLLTALNSGTGV